MEDDIVKRIMGGEFDQDMGRLIELQLGDDHQVATAAQDRLRLFKKGHIRATVKTEEAADAQSRNPDVNEAENILRKYQVDGVIIVTVREGVIEVVHCGKDSVYKSCMKQMAKGFKGEK